uniref:Calcium-transporting ATPase 2, plasma membrane-type-like n=1 Tax=Tanacetum cinerariifolium TaxID=118510 RepID=A0A6L2J2S7_TANCI|nr:calcium-transporting ATPase 2, plasma membrane-type-like [Tanacetum cinerariifolium]
MPDPLLDVYQNYPSARELWKALEERFFTKDAIRGLSRHTNSLGKEHWDAVNQVFKYLKKTIDYDLEYSGDPSVLEEFNKSLDYKTLGVNTIEDIVGMMGEEYVYWFEEGESKEKYAMSARMVEMRRQLYLKHEVQELLIRHGGEIEFNSFEDLYKDHFNQKLAYDYYGLPRGLKELCEILEDILVVEVANPSRKTNYMLVFNISLDYKALGVNRIEDIVEMRQKLYLKHEVQELLIRHGGEVEFNYFEDSYKDHFNEKLAYDYYGLTRGLEELCEILEDILVVEVANPSRKVFVWEALHDMTLMVLGSYAFVSLIVGIATEGWSKGAHDGLGIATSKLLVVFVTTRSYYRQSLQFKGLDKEKKKISIQVTRNAFRQKLSMYELLVGDIVHLAIGDQVPTDGLFILGFALSNSTVYITAMVSPSLECYLFKNIQGVFGCVIQTYIPSKTESG